MNVVQSNMTNLLEINLQRFLIDLIYIQILSNTIFFCDKVPWVARSKANISMIFMEQKAQHYTKNTKKLRLTVSCDASSSKQVELKFLDLVNFQSKQQLSQNFRDMFQFRYYHLAAMIIKPVRAKKMYAPYSQIRTEC